MNRVATRLGFTAVAIIAGVAPAMAQGTQTASIAGKVVTASGAAISGVTITISSPALQQQRTVASGVTRSRRERPEPSRIARSSAPTSLRSSQDLTTAVPASSSPRS